MEKTKNSEKLKENKEISESQTFSEKYKNCIDKKPMPKDKIIESDNLPENSLKYKKKDDDINNNLNKGISKKKQKFKKRFLIKIKNYFKKQKLDRIEEVLKKSDKKDKKNKEILEKEKILKKNISILKRKKRKAQISRYDRIRNLKNYLEKAGYGISNELPISKIFNIFIAGIVVILNIYLIYAGAVRDDRLVFILTQLLMTWIIILPTLIIIFWFIFYTVVDFKIYNRTKQLEEVLPDFLQLTSANLNAGMPLDKALWYAVRPRFGILAKEIEDVAKSTLIGEDLKDALLNLSKQYDSKMLQRTVNLMLEGLDAGGEIGPLLNKISNDIQETRIIKKDMAANVMTYVIFISFATIIAAPFLFALSSQVLTVIQKLTSNINTPSAGMGAMSMFNLSEEAVSLKDFNIFAVGALSMTSFFSAMIVSIIQKGNVKDGIKYIPIYILITVTLYLISAKGLSLIMGGML